MPRKPRKVDYLTIYFDTETFEQTVEGHKHPLIVPYNIGACTSEPNSYVNFLGVKATHQFINWLLKKSAGKKVTLVAFNLDYDFWAIYPILREIRPDLKINYKQTSERKFIGGEISGKKIAIKFRDLWVWDKEMSVAKYAAEIEKVRKDNPEKWNERLEQHKIEKVEKGSIDYKKVNLHPKEDGTYWYTDESGTLKQLDLEAEQAYLRQDVVMLPLIDYYIEDFKHTCYEQLRIPPLSKKVTVNSIPGFSKKVAEYILGETLDQGFRAEIPLELYKDMEASYYGGFTSLNELVDYLEECRDVDGKPKIVSFDVNSMYPAIMANGIPYGAPTSLKPKEVPFCTWYEIAFTDQIEPGKLYRWKKEFQFFNNDFFGKYFFPCQIANAFNSKRFILAEVLDLFDEMCEGHYEVLDVMYQPIDTRLTNFIHQLYEIKSDKSNSYVVRTAVKRVMNSLYGKFAERYHEEYYELTEKLAVPVLKPNDDPQRHTILAGLYITSMARVKLLSAVKTEVENGNTVLGCDTDSIKVVCHNPPKIDVHPTNLGAWKNEGQFTHFIHPNKCKKYLQYNSDIKLRKFASAGIPKSIVDSLSEEDLFKLFSRSNNVRFPKIKNASVRNDWGQIVIRKVDIEFNPPIEGARIVTHFYQDGSIIPNG